MAPDIETYAQAGVRAAKEVSCNALKLAQHRKAMNSHAPPETLNPKP